MASSYVAGYDDERFQSPVPKELHCCICFNVLREPMQCQRNEHLFCNECITRYLRQTQRCPNCKERLTLQTLKPSRVTRILISELIMKCDNSERGCTDGVKLEDQGHVARCKFSPVQCSNQGCEIVFNRKDKEGHETTECDFRLARCRVCGENVSYWKRELHCYVTREEMGEMKRDLKENKDEMFTVKELVLGMGKEMAKLTRGIGEMKDQMGEMKREIAAIKEECHRSKQEPKSDVHSLGASSACFQPSINNREQRMMISSLIREDIIIAGGCLLKSVEMFSWTTRQWTRLPPMTSPRYFSSSFVHEGQMFVCGGGRKSRDTMESLELKKEGEQWKEIQAKLPQETLGHASIVYNEHVYIFGGERSDKILSNIYKVSLVSPYSSQLLCDLPEPRCHHGAQRFGDQVAIFGGTPTGGSSDSLDSIFLYDITRNCCRPLAPLPFAVSYMATVAWRDNIIIIGGKDKNGKLNTVVSYNITNENSKMLPPMKEKRSSCAAVITENVIVVMGGNDEEENDVNAVESFSFDHYSWEELPPMNEKRFAATAIVKSLP